jgi:GntR family transcriptional regulator
MRSLSPRAAMVCSSVSSFLSSSSNMKPLLPCRVPLDNCTVLTYTIHMASPPQLRINLASSVPVVRQIVESIRVLLVEGKLEIGAVLPSTRRMAMELGIHFNTVAEAYRELAGEGWLDLKHGRGAVVRERGAPAAGSGQLTEFRERLRRLAAHMQASGIAPRVIARELRKIAEGLSK